MHVPHASTTFSHVITLPVCKSRFRKRERSEADENPPKTKGLSKDTLDLFTELPNIPKCGNLHPDDENERAHSHSSEYCLKRLTVEFTVVNVHPANEEIDQNVYETEEYRLKNGRGERS